MIYEHEDLQIDSTVSSKTRLYKDDKLVFIGDGYKAITMMINNSKNPEPVKQKFHAQLTMTEKPKFSKGDDIETLRKQALDDHAQSLVKKKRRR